jgi:predicted dehydrogenase
LDLIVSSDPDRVRKQIPEATVEPNFDRALARDGIDLVVIATPNQTHVALATAALQAGKHVVVDKPFTTTVAEARALAELNTAS